MATVVTRGSRANVRAGPGESFPVVGTRHDGDTVVVAELRGGWSRIGPGQWISGNLVQESGATPDPDTLDAVVPHPNRPDSPRWRVLIGFETGSAELRESHRAWLSGFASSQARAGQHVWIRGMASRLGDERENGALSLRRGRAVADYLVNQCRVPRRMITGAGGVGESWARGSETEDDARSRAVEVILTNNVIELPGSFIIGRSPVSTSFYIKYMGSGSGGEVVGGDVALFIIRNHQDYWQRYHYEGGGISGGAPISWGEALPPGRGWVRFTTSRPMSVDAFAGGARLTQASAQVGSAGVGTFRLTPDTVHRTLDLPTGSGFSLGGSSTIGRLSTAGGIEDSGGWRYY